MDILYILIVLAIAYALVSVTIQRKFGNMKRVRELQSGMKTKMDEYKQKIKNNAATEELSAIQKEISSISSEMMKHQLKPMLFLLPLLVLVYYWILPNYFPGGAVQFFMFTFTYRITFILIAVVLGLVLSSSLMLYERKVSGGLKMPTPAVKEAPES